MPSAITVIVFFNIASDKLEAVCEWNVMKVNWLEPWPIVWPMNVQTVAPLQQSFTSRGSKYNFIGSKMKPVFPSTPRLPGTRFLISMDCLDEASDWLRMMKIHYSYTSLRSAALS